MPGAAEIDFEPPRAKIDHRPADFSSCEVAGDEPAGMAQPADRVRTTARFGLIRAARVPRMPANARILRIDLAPAQAAAALRLSRKAACSATNAPLSAFSISARVPATP